MPSIIDPNYALFILDVRKVGKSLVKKLKKYTTEQFKYKDHPIGCILASSTYVILLTSEKAYSGPSGDFAIWVMIQDRSKTLARYMQKISSRDTYTKSDLKKSEENILGQIIEIIKGFD